MEPAMLATVLHRPPHNKPRTRNTNQNPQKSNTPTKNQILYHQSKPKPTHYKTHHHNTTTKRKREEKLQTHHHDAGFE